MDVTINPSPIQGTIAAVASKSEAHRMLVCAALANATTDLTCSTSSVDIDATASCLRSLGARVTRTKPGFRVVPVREVPHEALLDCCESGSTLRFMLPVVAALGCDASLTGRGRLAERPLSPLYERLEEHGCTLSEQGAFPLEVRGRLSGGRFVLPGNVSSQYVTGLLLAAPLVGQTVEVLVEEPVESLPYITITTDVMSRFGVRVMGEKVVEGDRRYQRYVVAEGSSYSSPGSLAVGGDWSNSAFWLAAGAVSPAGLAVTGLDLASTQGDRQILGALALLGARVSRGRSAVSVTPDRLAATTLDVTSCPDLVPPIALVAALAQGTTTIKGAARLRLKESDRLKTVSAALDAMGAHVTPTNDGLVIEGVPALSGGTVDAANDHRIAMMAAVAATVAEGPTTITGAECVSKSYPTFFEDLALLGAHVER